LRNAYVRQHPVCELKVMCDGDATAEVDHIIPIDAGGALLDEKNLQGVCKRCHSWKTNNVDRHRHTKKFRW
jgi:5-methylcytosine-specific restriction endonuclease McrA